MAIEKLDLYSCFRCEHATFWPDIVKNMKLYIIRIIRKKFIIALFFTGCSIIPFVIWRQYNVLYFGGGNTIQDSRITIMQMLGYLWNIQAYLFPFITFGVFGIIKFLFQIVKKLLNQKMMESMG